MVSFYLNGREIKFSKNELLFKLIRLEKLESTIVTESKLAINNNIASKPTENMCFKVNLATIDETLFKKKRTNFMQEWTRKAIVLGLNEAKKYPEKYGKTFFTFIPNKTWHINTVANIINIATFKNCHIADWVEQTLEWAQRISNGESWEVICNEPDNLNWYRLIIWKDNHVKIVGGSKFCTDNLPPSAVFGNHINLSDILEFSVPLIIISL